LRVKKFKPVFKKNLCTREMLIMEKDVKSVSYGNTVIKYAIVSLFICMVWVRILGVDLIFV